MGLVSHQGNSPILWSKWKAQWPGLKLMKIIESSKLELQSTVSLALQVQKNRSSKTWANKHDHPLKLHCLFNL